MPQQNVSVDESLISYEEEEKEKAQIQNFQISYVCNEYSVALM